MLFIIFSVLFARMDQFNSTKKQQQNIQKILENGRKYWKSQEKVREFCQSGKMGTMIKINWYS